MYRSIIDAGDYIDHTTQYAKDVLAKRIIAGPFVRAACKRHIDDLTDGYERGLSFSLKKADRVFRFFETQLYLNGGDFEGLPFALQPWQKFILGSLFGWLGPDGYRRFRTAYLEIGKGNGKSPLAAGIGIYGLMADGEARAEIYAAATKRDQAMILFRDAIAMVQLSENIQTRVEITGGTKPDNIMHKETNSWFRVIASDNNSQSGTRPHISLIDEIHEHQDDTVIRMLKLGQKTRKQPLQVEITNSGVDRTSICFQHHEYSERVVKGLEDKHRSDAWFAYVCALDEITVIEDGKEVKKYEDPLKDKKCWVKANPNLGVSITERYLQDSINEAAGMPASLSMILRLNFCVWTDAASPWLPEELWKAIEDPSATRQDGLRCVGAALDLSGVSDLTALALAFVNQAGELFCRVEFWTPGDTVVERSKREHVPYDVWVREGYMHAEPGHAIDYSKVAERIVELEAEVGLNRLAFDPYRIKFLKMELDKLGSEIRLIPHPQAFATSAESELWMPRSIELLEEKIKHKQIKVLTNPCLRWNVACAVTESDAKNNRTFVKRKSKGRIDGIQTLAMVVGLAAMQDESTRSVYEDRGVLEYY